MKIFIRIFGTGLLLVLACVTIYFSQKYTWSIIEKHFYELGSNPGYIPSGQQVRPAVLGLDHFVSDLYWIRTVQYAGGNSGSFQFDSLPEYIDLITDLDPHFGFAYHFGALTFPLNEVAIDRVVPLLEKGIKLNKDSNPELLPQMYIDLAFHKYYYEDDLDGGAETYEYCAKNIEGCPPYAKNVAAFLRAKVGKHEIALQLWLGKVFDEEEKSKEELELISRKIEESSKLVALTCAEKNYEKKYGTPISQLDDLLNEPVHPCEGFVRINPKLRMYLQKVSADYDLQVVSPRTLTSPYSHNPFQWDAENNKISAKYWLQHDERAKERLEKRKRMKNEE